MKLDDCRFLLSRSVIEAGLTKRPAYGSVSVESNNSIHLSPTEQLLREFLLECMSHFPGLKIWITGGWVRDRLLGTPSSDLDFGLNNLTGRQFGTFIEDFSAKPETDKKYSQKAADLGVPAKFTRFHIMERNADMSKKLETAGGNLFGLAIDLVNLRKEVYDGCSRTPEMEFGTPEEDAFRRDATVNSLFFDLQEEKVIDLTGKGLEDLEARIMRTPLDPRQTFMDDPLRVLRLIRIGSKLRFTLDKEAINCMKDIEIRQALDTIITRDRVGIEIFKMIKGPNPEVAFGHLFECNLYSPVFLRLKSSLLSKLQTEFPVLGSPTSTPWPKTWPQVYQLLVYLLQSDSGLGKLAQCEKLTDHLWAMAAYAPIAELRKSLLEQVVQEATNAIKAPSKITKLLDSALRNFDHINKMIDLTADQSEDPVPRSVVGMAIRSWGAAWSTQVTYVVLAKAAYTSPSCFSPELSACQHAKGNSLSGPILKKYAAFADFVLDQNLEDAHLQRPLLDGNEVQQLFGLSKGGKFIKDAIDAQLAWHFDRPHSGVREAKEWLLGQRERLGIPPRDETTSSP